MTQDTNRNSWVSMIPELEKHGWTRDALYTGRDALYLRGREELYLKVGGSPTHSRVTSGRYVPDPSERFECEIPTERLPRKGTHARALKIVQSNPPKYHAVLRYRDTSSGKTYTESELQNIFYNDLSELPAEELAEITYESWRGEMLSWGQYECIDLDEFGFPNIDDDQQES